MTTADYALIVSICAAAVSLVSLGWNIWSKFIYPKPRIRVSAGISLMFWMGVSSNRHIAVSVTNHGPGDVTLHSINIRTRPKAWAKREWATLSPIDNFPDEPYRGVGPFGGGLPKLLKPGEGHTLRFPYEERAFLGLKHLEIGAQDTFGRYHWASRRNVRETQTRFRNDFPNPKGPWADAEEPAGEPK